MLFVSHSFLPVHTNPPTRFSFSSISRANPKFFQVLSSLTFGEKQKPSPLPASEDERKGGPEPMLEFLAPFPAIKMPKRVVIVRHGQSTWNGEGRIQGRSDFSVLTVKGEAQAETSRQMLIDDLFEADAHCEGRGTSGDFTGLPEESGAAGEERGGEVERGGVDMETLGDVGDELLEKSRRLRG